MRGVQQVSCNSLRPESKNKRMGPQTEAGRLRCGNWKHGQRCEARRREEKRLTEFVRACRETIRECLSEKGKTI